MLKRFAKLKGLSPGEVLEALSFKAGMSLQALGQDFRIRVVRRIWPRRKSSAVRCLRDDLHFFGVEEWRARKHEIAEALEGQTGYREQVKNAAERCCLHEFNLLGSGPARLGERIDWHRDFKSGARWAPRYFKQIKDIELGDSSDIKVPWELSRCYHFAPLGIAYWLTGDEKYALEFVTQIRYWCAANSPYYGVNWHCAMEVAIRAINWSWGYYLFRDSKHLDSAAKSLLASSLAMHGEFIWHNLEVAKRVVHGHYMRHNGNHYISDLVGLIYLGLVLPGPKAKRWLDWSLRELGAEMEVEVLSDGAHWELSPSYHRLVLELVLPALILCSQNNVAVPRSLYRGCEAMAEYMMHYLKPNGLCPLVRDADDGRVCLLNDCDNSRYRDHRHLLGLAGAFFGRADFLGRAGELAADVLWMLGPSCLETARHMGAASVRLASKAFPEAGFYVLRGGELIHVFVNCADVGMKGSYGGHAHNDCLSFELFYQGTTFITDCGTYNYSGDPAGRNEFRSTASHNTARIDREEINRFSATELFSMENDARPKVLNWQTGADRDCLQAEHYGYARLQHPVTHRRSFLLDRAAHCLVITDEFNGSGEHLFEVFFHFSPEVQVQAVSSHRFQVRASHSFVCLDFTGSGVWNARLEQGWVSERYGRKQPAPQLILASRQSAPAQLATTILLSEAFAELDLTDGLGGQQMTMAQGHVGLVR